MRLETADVPRPEAVPSAMRMLRDRGARARDHQGENYETAARAEERLDAVKLASTIGEQEKRPTMQRVPREILADFMREKSAPKEKKGNK